MQVVRYKTHNGTFTGIHVGDGRKFFKLILMDAAGIRIIKEPLGNKRFMTVLEYRTAKARKLFRAAGRRFGITKSAKKALRG